jgi:hypothetical protein
VTNVALRSEWFAAESVASDLPTVTAMFRFLGTDVVVETASVGLLQDWTARYGAFRVQPGPPEITVRVHGHDGGSPLRGGVTIERDGQRWYRDGTAEALPPLGIPPLDRWVYLHGAAVGRAGQAVLLLGPPRAGKSLLALSVVARGAKLLADGLLPLDPEDLLVAPFPEALRLHRLELAQLDIDPAHPALVPYRTSTGTLQWRADPHRLLGGRAARVAADAAAVVFLDAAPAAAPCLEPLPADRALSLLVPRLHGPPARLEEPARQAITRLCEQAPSYRLTVGPVTAAAELLDRQLLA